jgi:hypothetical protein
MSATQYATNFKCDYPGCQSVCVVSVHRLDRDTPPAGWLNLDYKAMQILDPWGMRMTDFCTLHADIPISKLAAVLDKIREAGHP